MGQRDPKSTKKRPAWLVEAGPTAEQQPTEGGSPEAHRAQAGSGEYDATALDRATEGPEENRPANETQDPFAEAPTVHLPTAGNPGPKFAPKNRGGFPAEVLHKLDGEAGKTTGRAQDAAGVPGAGGARPGPLDWLRSMPGRLTGQNRRRLVYGALVAFALLCFLYGLRMLPGMGHPEEDAGGGPASPGRAALADPDAASSPVRDTGAVFGGLDVDGPDATLSGAGLAWDGTVDAGEAGETITLTGPTAAQIRRGFELPRSSIQSGVYAVSRQSGRVLHVVYHTFSAGETEITQGSIFAVKDDRLGYAGFYRDERQKGSQKVVRTYMPPGGNNYRVSFEAPEGTPVPLLVGFRGGS